MHNLPSCAAAEQAPTVAHNSTPPPPPRHSASALQHNFGFYHHTPLYEAMAIGPRRDHGAAAAIALRIADR
jgi:hypothetical protein